MNIHKRLLIPILLHFSVLFLFGQRGAQDTWYLDKELQLPDMPGLSDPFGLAFSSDGDSYVVDHSNDSVTIWDSNGTFLIMKMTIESPLILELYLAGSFPTT